MAEVGRPQGADTLRDYDGLAAYLAALPYEGIVWWHPDRRMAKIKRRDFPVPADPDGEETP